jgi:hypothetical protein
VPPITKPVHHCNADHPEARTRQNRYFFSTLLGKSYVLLTQWRQPGIRHNLADRMATADASGPFQWPLIDGMVAVNRAGGVAVEVQEVL